MTRRNSQENIISPFLKFAFFLIKLNIFTVYGENRGLFRISFCEILEIALFVSCLFSLPCDLKLPLKLNQNSTLKLFV